MRTTTGNDDRGGGSPVHRLAEIADAKQRLAREEAVAVRQARQAGLSWAEIGTLLGVTRQAMHKKYGRS